MSPLEPEGKDWDLHYLFAKHGALNFDLFDEYVHNKDQQRSIIYKMVGLATRNEPIIWRIQFPNSNQKLNICCMHELVKMEKKNKN